MSDQVEIKWRTDEPQLGQIAKVKRPCDFGLMPAVLMECKLDSFNQKVWDNGANGFMWEGAEWIPVVSQDQKIDLFEFGPFERMVSEALRVSISRKGPITYRKIASVSNMIIGDIREKIRSVSVGEKFICQAHEAEIKNLTKELKRQRELTARAMKQEWRWRKLMEKHKIPLNSPLEEKYVPANDCGNIQEQNP